MAQADSKVVDPVCGMTIDPASAAGSSTYAGKTYYFCSGGCKTKFDAAPDKYAAQAEGIPGPARG